MKLALDATVNVLLGVTCLVIISVGALELRTRLSGDKQAATPTEQPAPPSAARTPPAEDVSGLTIPTDQAIVKSRGTPKVALIEFSDFECPFCEAYASGAYQQIQRDFVESGKVAYVWFNFPMERLHPRALKAAQALECAAQQGRPWEMHDKLFENQKALADADLIRHAQGLGLGMEEFDGCIAEKTVAKIRAQMALGERAGIRGTPSFLVGQVQPNGEIRVTKRITGAASYDVFRSELDAALEPALAAARR